MNWLARCLKWNFQGIDTFLVLHHSSINGTNNQTLGMYEGEHQPVHSKTPVLTIYNHLVRHSGYPDLELKIHFFILNIFLQDYLLVFAFWSEEIFPDFG